MNGLNLGMGMSTRENLKSNSVYPWLIFVGCCALMFSCIGIAMNCSGLFVKAVSTEFKVGATPMSLMATISFISTVLALPFAGKLMSKGRIRLFTTGAALTLGCLWICMGLTTAMWQFYIIGIGLGAAKAVTTYLAVPLLISSWFKKNVGFFMGLAMMFSGIGGAIFAPIGGHLISDVGWRVAYMILGGSIMLISLPFTLFIFRDSPRGMGLAAYGEEKENKETIAKPAATGVPANQAYKSLSFLFCLLFGTLLGFLCSFGFFCVHYFESLGYLVKTASIALSAIMIGGIFGKALIGWLNDRLGAIPGAIIGVSFGFAGMIVFYALPQYGLTVLTAGAFLVGAGLSCTFLEPPLVVRALFGNKDHTLIYSRVSSGLAFGGAVGFVLLGSLSDLFGGYAEVLLILMIIQLVTVISLLLAAKFSGRLVPCNT